VVVFLPEKRGLACGDWVAGDMPSISEVRPYEWIETRKKAGKLDFDSLIPGHGDVLRGKERLVLGEQYLADLMQATTKAWGIAREGAR
jgi:glyoxylase-like metal-dependent hydrolase (beta-lactamase superfamily II)